MPYSPLDMADAFIKAGELQDALDTLNQHLATTSEDEALRLRAELLLRFNNLPQALADFDALVQPTPDDEMRRSVIFERMGNHAAALDSAEKAYHARPDERFAERCLQLFLSQNKLDAAAKLLDAQPQTWRWQQWRGDVAAVREDWHTAHAAYQAALTDVEKSTGFVWVAAVEARLHLALADVCIHLSDYAQADEHYRAAETLIPDDPMIPFNRGLLAALQNNPAEAVALCRAAYEDAPAALRERMASALRGDVRYNEIVETVLR